MAADAEKLAIALDRGASLDLRFANETEEDPVAGMQLLYTLMSSECVDLGLVAEKQGQSLAPYIAQLNVEQLGDWARVQAAPEVVRFVLKRWPNEDWKTHVLAGGNTLLHKVSEMGNGPYVKTLVELGAQVEVRNEKGQTALHLAGTRQVVRALLIDGHADPLTQDLRGNTALMEASGRMVKHLKRTGGNTAGLDLAPILLLAGREGLLNDPKSRIVARRLDQVRRAGLSETVSTAMETVWNQVDTVMAGIRRERLERVAQGQRNQQDGTRRAL